MAIFHYQIVTPEGNIAASGAVRAIDVTTATERIAKKEAFALAPLPLQTTPNVIHIINMKGNS